MSVELYAFTCGHLTIPHGFLLEGREGWITVPIPAYLIVHPKGRAVFDSGLHIQAQTDPVGYMGEACLKYATFHFHPGEELAARLAAMQVDAASVDYVINSHWHYDHAGGNAQVPNADVVVQGREVSHAFAAGAAAGYLKQDFDTGQRLRQVDGEHDPFGDGSVVCLPTYGHTPGHQSLRVRTADGEFILCGDACYLKESLDNLHAPGVIADKAAAVSVFHRFRQMQARGARIMYGHDPAFWKTIPQAPVRLG
ncbi:N-acyl homoserine lactonase family protein [Phenylobacterium sp.]|uniref:N-acyl homoserine lactonase family protein n=1 Tax=Phenylobacterium sp. TaxID=1871053 RepID=UPI002FC93971